MGQNQSKKPTTMASRQRCNKMQFKMVIRQRCNKTDLIDLLEDPLDLSSVRTTPFSTPKQVHETRERKNQRPADIGRNITFRDMGCISGNYSKAIPKSITPVNAPPKKSTDLSADSKAIPASILKQQLGMEIPLVERNCLVPSNDMNSNVPRKFLGDLGTVVSLNEDMDPRGLISSRSPMGDDYSRTLQTNPSPQLISSSRGLVVHPTRKLLTRDTCLSLAQEAYTRLDRLRQVSYHHELGQFMQ